MKNLLFFFVLTFNSTQIIAQTNFDVSAEGMSFTPDALTIHRGDTVTWTNNGGTHNVHEDNGYFFNGNPDNSNWSFSVVFDTVGTFHYQCDQHGPDMDGVITVLETGTGISSINEGVKISLEQNYPNPFIQQTTIDYALSSAGDVKIEIYNMLGQKIKTVKNTLQPAGNYSIIWDATNDKGLKVPHGNYFYQLQINGEKLTKRMSFTQ